MQPAAGIARAVLGNIDDALGGKPVGHALAEGRLVENDELPSWAWQRIGERRAIDPFKDRLRLVVVAVADKGLLGEAAGRAFRLGQEGVAALPLDQCHARLGHAGGGVEALGRLDHGPLNGLILIAGEEIDLVVGET